MAVKHVLNNILASVNPPWMVTMPNLSHSQFPDDMVALMPPSSLPYVTPAQFHSHKRPDIHAPSAWNKLLPSDSFTECPQYPSGSFYPSAWSRPTPSMNFPPGFMSYRADHVQYMAKKACWASIAHQGPTAEMISLEIAAPYENNGKKKNPCRNVAMIGVSTRSISKNASNDYEWDSGHWCYKCLEPSTFFPYSILFTVPLLVGHDN